ncbi:hypothetical protein LIER_00126 [Lithospermum erythrorhizon]|uniref:Integrase catalytic domain-containing protein n=1 Tax=Lithospermum erythrorhizon TaxID=34254 RepID=A0AAV3NGB4_LITER
MCQRLGIEHRFALVCYPQYNGQVEVMNRTIFLEIKKNLLESGAKCTEAVLPLEVCLPNIRQIGFKEDQNTILDFGDKGRDRAIAKMQKYKQTMAKFYNRRVKNRQFVAGNVVMRIFKARLRTLTN